MVDVFCNFVIISRQHSCYSSFSFVESPQRMSAFKCSLLVFPKKKCYCMYCNILFFILLSLFFNSKYNSLTQSFPHYGSTVRIADYATVASTLNNRQKLKKRCSWCRGIFDLITLFSSCLSHLNIVSLFTTYWILPSIPSS